MKSLSTICFKINFLFTILLLTLSWTLDSYGETPSTINLPQCANNEIVSTILVKESFREYEVMPTVRKFLKIDFCKSLKSEVDPKNDSTQIYIVSNGNYFFGEEEPLYGKDQEVHPLSQLANGPFMGKIQITKYRSNGCFGKVESDNRSIAIQGNFYNNSEVSFSLDGKVYPASIILYPF